MPSLTVQLASTEAAAHEARQLVRKRLRDLVPASMLWDLLTVVTELVTNAVRHGPSDTVQVRLVVADDKITGEVENDGRGRGDPRLIEPQGTSGLGLHIVGAIAERWRVHVNGSTLVRFELRA